MALDDACAAMGFNATQCAVPYVVAQLPEGMMPAVSDMAPRALGDFDDHMDAFVPLDSVRSFGRFSLSDVCDWDYLCGVVNEPEFQEGGVNRQGLRAGHVHGAGERQGGDDAGGDDRMAARLCASGSGSRPIGALRSFGAELARARAKSEWALV